MCRDSSVPIATGYGFDSRQGNIFCSPRCPDRVWGPPSLFGVKQPGHELATPASSFEVNDGRAIPSFHHVSLWNGALLIDAVEYIAFKVELFALGGTAPVFDWLRS